MTYNIIPSYFHLCGKGLHEKLFSQRITWALRGKCPNTELFLGLYFPVFGLEITPYLDTFHAVGIANKSEQLVCFCQNYWLQNRKFVTIAAYFGELFCTFLRNLNFPRLNLQKITLVNLTKQLGAVVQWYSEKWHKISRKTWETRTTFHKLAVLQATVFWK